jgi:hypothetical protein
MLKFSIHVAALSFLHLYCFVWFYHLSVASLVSIRRRRPMTSRRIRASLPPFSLPGLAPPQSFSSVGESLSLSQITLVYPRTVAAPWMSFGSFYSKEERRDP